MLLLLFRCVQVVLATLLIVLVLFYAPIWANVAVFVMSLVAVLLVVVLLESRSILRDFLHLKVRFESIHKQYCERGQRGLQHCHDILKISLQMGLC